MLIDDMRKHVKVCSTMSDDEIEDLIAAALSNLRAGGVREELLRRDDMDPAVKFAVISFCKANYGFDNNDSDRYFQRYEWQRLHLLNSSKNETLYEGE